MHDCIQGVLLIEFDSLYFWLDAHGKNFVSANESLYRNLCCSATAVPLTLRKDSRPLERGIRFTVDGNTVANSAIRNLAEPVGEPLVERIQPNIISAGSR